jgi:hypothetical protein
MYVASQFSVFMVNKPGMLAKALGEFAKERVNIVAITMMDSAEHGVMRVVFEESKRAREILTRLNMPYSETDVLCVNLANKSGALATVAEKLAKADHRRSEGFGRQESHAPAGGPQQGKPGAAGSAPVEGHEGLTFPWTGNLRASDGMNSAWMLPCHARENGGLGKPRRVWIPAFVEMTPDSNFRRTIIV